MITIKEISNYLESFAPLAYQETYDNCGLLVGDQDQIVNKILVSLDCTEEVVEEAINKNCNLIISHHPIVFKGLKKLTASNYVERTVIKAIRNNIALYAIHTNLDNVQNGVNYKIAEKLNLQDVKILVPKTEKLKKITFFTPTDNLSQVLSALYEVGAGQIGNYKNCSFSTEGIGTYMPLEGAKPYIGTIAKQEEVKEIRSELIFPNNLENKIIAALIKNHPYQEVAYYIQTLDNKNYEIGSGAIGRLETEMEPQEFIMYLKKQMKLQVVKCTKLPNKKITKVAICGGSGSTFLSQAISSGADVFISADFKYHEYFDADNKILIADIGHYESEFYTKELINELIWKKFVNIAVVLSETITNPISYL